MTTDQDYRLEPQSGPLSKVICNHCDREIGEVHTAATTPTGSKAQGSSEEDITLRARNLVGDHLQQCHPGKGDDIASYENEPSQLSAEHASMNRPRGGPQ